MDFFKINFCANGLNSKMLITTKKKKFTLEAPNNYN
jgi:hypothetical protein